MKRILIRYKQDRRLEYFKKIKFLGYSSFADAVAAYNEQHGTNYTVDEAKESLGQ